MQPGCCEFPPLLPFLAQESKYPALTLTEVGLDLFPTSGFLDFLCSAVRYPLRAIYLFDY